MSSTVIGAIAAALILTGDKEADIYFTEPPPEGETSLWVCAYDGESVMRCGTIDQFVDHMESRQEKKDRTPIMPQPRPHMEEL